MELTANKFENEIAIEQLKAAGRELEKRAKDIADNAEQQIEQLRSGYDHQLKQLTQELNVCQQEIKVLQKTIDSTKREALQSRHDLEARHAAEKAQLEHRLLHDFVPRADHQLQAERAAKQLQQLRNEMSSKAKENAENGQNSPRTKRRTS